MATIAERINKAKQDNSKANGNKTSALSIEERIKMAKQHGGKVEANVPHRPAIPAATSVAATGSVEPVAGGSSLDELLSQRTHVQNEKESWRNKANWLVGGGPAKEGITFVPQKAVDEAWERYNMYDQWEKELDEQIAQANAAPGALEQAKADGTALLDAGAREQKKTAVRAKAQADADALAGYTSSAPGSDLQNMALLLAGAKGKETAEKRAKELDFVGERLEDTYTADGFLGGHIGQFEANNDLGRINQESGKAWDDYLVNPTEENRERAFMYAALAEKVAGNAKGALDYNSKAKWLTQSVAGYLPQWWDQTTAQIKGGVAGAVAGSAGGVGGVIAGARLGATAAAQQKTYSQVRGQVFRDLVLMGVDEATAREAANDEAFLSSAIESIETFISFGALGVDDLVGAFTGAAKKAGAKGLTAKLLAKLPTKLQPAAKIGVDAVKGAAKNTATEYAEEFSQQGVSIANQRRMEGGGETGMLGLAGETAKTIGRALIGQDTKALGQMHESGKQGAILGAFGAGTTQVVNQAAGLIASKMQAKSGPLMQDNFEKGTKTAAPKVETAVNENGLTALTEQEKTNLSSGKKNKVISTFSEAVSFIKNALSNKQSVDRAYLGKVPDGVAERVLEETGVDITGYNAILPSDAVRHMFSHHGDLVKEAVRGQVGLTVESAAKITTVLSSPDRVSLSNKTDSFGRTTLIFEKQIGDYYITAQAVSDGTHSIQTDTLYIRKKKDPQDTVSDADVSTVPEQNARSVPPQDPSTNATIPHPANSVNSPTVSNNIAAELVNAGATEAEAEKLAPILTAVLTGEEISGNQAGAIARNGAAVSVLESATGEAINTDAPLGEVKSTIRGLASRRGTQGAQTVAEDTPAQVQPVETREIALDSAGIPPVATNGKESVLEWSGGKDLVNGQETRYTETKGAQSNEEAHLRAGGQWTDGTHSGGAVSEVESRTGGNQVRQEQGRPADPEAASLTYGEAVSTASLGIGKGSERATIRVVTGGDTADTRAAKQLAKERGLRLTLFVGDNLNINGESLRAYITGDRAFVRADHSDFTSAQLMRHETGHDMIAKGEIDPQTVRERIAERFGGEQLDRVAQMYIEAYAGSGLTAEEIWEEVICDSLGDMNIFSETVSEDAARELLTATKAASADAKAETSRGPPAATGTNAGGKMSVELNDLADNIQKGSGIRWNGGRTITLSKSEYAAVVSRISSRYHYANTQHDGVQIIDRSTDGKNAQHYVYLYTDHGFGSYQIIGRLTYGRNNALINFLREEIGNDRTAEGVSAGTDRLRNFYEHTGGSRVTHYDRTSYDGNEQADTRSRGVKEESDRRTGRADTGRYDDGSHSGTVTSKTSLELERPPVNEGKASREWQTYELTDEYMQTVKSGDRHAFLRTLANNTVGIKKNKPRRLMFAINDTVYFFTATGYMNGHMEKTRPILGNEDMVAKTREVFKSGTDKGTKASNSLAQSYRVQRGRNDWDNPHGGHARKAGRADGLHGGESRKSDPAGRFDEVGGDAEYEEIPGSLIYDGEGHAYEVGEDGSRTYFSHELETVEQRQSANDNASIELARPKVERAAERYTALIDEYGAIPAGENPARDVQVPKRTADNQKVSQTVRTILEAKATPDVAIPTIEELTATGDFSYEVYTDKQAMADAENTIRDKGYNSALMDWMKSVQEGEVSKSNTALGWALYNQAANAGALKTAMAILTNMVGHQRNAAQAVQATRILKKMSPEAQLYGVQRSAQNLAEELEKRYGKDAPDVRVNEELARKYLEAETDKEREESMRNLYRDLGRQMPSRFIDKWNAWRYLSMLGNPRTHVRNVLGNAFFAPVVAAKNMTAMAIEEAVYRVSGGKLERTKGSVGFGKQSRELLSAAWSDYESVADQVSSGGKYSDLDHSNQYIQEGRRIFKNRALEAARKGNSAALEAEDMWFSRPHYAYALAQYCKAHGITAEQMKNGKGLDRARAYAIKEAQKATYRDTNAFSQTISELGRYRGNNKVKKGVGVALEGILPFRKTPANILVRGLEYSPAGFLKGLFWDTWQIKSGKKTAAEVIDHISAGLTGSGLLALGAFLAAQGLVRGAGGDDEEKKEFEELQGHQTYAMELPDGTSVTLDWLAPEALPFFVGVNLWEQKAGNKDGGVTLSDILTATANVTEPLLELSCLQSLNDVFDAVGYAASDGLPALPSALASAATSYLTQGFPTILGQAERTGEDKRMTTYTEKDAFLTPDMQYTIGRISARLPGVDYQQIPYIDAWGRMENTGTGVERAGNNFLNPAYTSTVETSPMEDELLRLYEQIGEGSVLPSRAAKYFNVDGERKDLTAQEYVKYAQVKGQTAYKVLTALTGSQAYRKMSDAEKAEAVGLVYDYANATAKTKVSAYKPEGWIAKAVKTEKAAGVKAEQYVTLYLAQKDIESLKEADGDTIANSKSLLVMEMVYDVKGLTDAQRRALFEDFGVGKSVIHYNKTLVQQKLNEMRRKAG